MYSEDNLRFRRDHLRGGLINPDTAIRLGDFLFAADSQLQNMHLENRSELLTGESFSLLAASGFIRQDGGKTSLIYGKLTALKTLSPQVDAYVQTSHGKVRSQIYNDAALSGLSFGVFADKIFRRDDSAHFGLERRFGDAEKELWQLSADLQIGSEESHVRFGLVQEMQGGTQANILYRRQF